MSVAGRRSNRGDEYQLAIATHWAISLIYDNTIEYIQVDAVVSPDHLEKIFVDDVAIKYVGECQRYVQVKKNQTNRQNWSLKDSTLAKELIKARDQLTSSAHSIVEFVSRTPFGDFGRLLEDSTDYGGNYGAFVVNAPKSLTQPLNDLSKIWKIPAQEAFELVQRLEIGSAHSLDDWEQLNKERIGQRFTNPDLVIAVLEKEIRGHQSSLSNTSSKLSKEGVLNALAEQGLYPLSQVSEREIRESFRRVSAIGRNWPRDIASQKIPRSEVSLLLELIGDETDQSIVLTDGPGTGKTCVLLDLVDQLEEYSEWVSLFIKADQFAECRTELDLAEVGLPTDITGAISRIAGSQKVVVVIDSLDVLSIQRDHGSLGLFLRLIDQIERIHNVVVVVACRSFDLDYDPLLSGRSWGNKVELQPIDFDESIKPLLDTLKINSDVLNDELKQLLTIPQNLRLFTEVVRRHGLADGISDTISSHQLHEYYLREVVLVDSELGNPAMQLLESMAADMVQRRSLVVSRASLGRHESVLRRLLSQGVLLESTAESLQLSHQTLLDTLSVRSAMSSKESLLAFIQKHPPTPFVRPVIRNYVLYLRAHLPHEFSRQLRAAIQSDVVAYHLKRMIVETCALMLPVESDFSLINFLTNRYPDLFKRMLWKMKTIEWFELLHAQWWPNISMTGDDDLRLNYVQWAGNWKNECPDVLLSLWQDVLNSQWGSKRNIAWTITVELRKFEHWHLDEIEALLVKLNELNPEDDNQMGKPISRYVEATGQGLDLLWEYIAGRICAEDISAYRLGNKLRVSEYHFHRKAFLTELFQASDDFLKIVIQAIERWSAKDGLNYRTRGLRGSLLHHTSWQQLHSLREIHHHGDLEYLFSILETELKRRSRLNDEWWNVNEPDLRSSRDLAIRYVLILAYKENIEANIEGISAQLLEYQLLRFSDLEYEVGELANLSYPYLSPSVQDQHQRLLHELLKDGEWSEEVPTWMYHRVYDHLKWLPAPYRTYQTQNFLNDWQVKFGDQRPVPDIRSSGGTVRSPISVQNFMGLSSAAMIHYLRHYDEFTDSEIDLRDFLIGGREQVCRVVSDAASLDPIRYLSLFEKVLLATTHLPYLNSIIDGCASHLNYRFGNTSPPNNEWSPVKPFPEGEDIVSGVLFFLERYPQLWIDEWSIARALEGCVQVVSNEKNMGRVVFLLFKMLKAKKPLIEEVRINSHERHQVSEDDLSFDALNTPRAIAAGAAAAFTHRLLDGQQPLPELLMPLLRFYCKDDVSSVRAAVLRYIPYLIHKDANLGWQMMDDLFANSHPALWELTGDTLYYNYHHDFSKVKIYLDRMLLESSGNAGDVWAHISALAVIEGLTDQDGYFQQLEHLNSSKAWASAAGVFTANIGHSSIGDISRACLLRVLRRDNVPNDVISNIDRHLQKGEVRPRIDMEVADAFIDAINKESKRHELMGFIDWISHAVRVDPLACLDVVEKFSQRIEDVVENIHYMLSDPLINALAELLREADESDDPVVIKRVVGIQDRLLRIGIRGIEDMIEKAT